MDTRLEVHSVVESFCCACKSENKSKVIYLKTQQFYWVLINRNVSAYLDIIRWQISTTLNIVYVWRVLRSHHLAKNNLYEI